MIILPFLTALSSCVIFIHYQSKFVILLIIIRVNYHSLSSLSLGSYDFCIFCVVIILKANSCRHKSEHFVWFKSLFKKFINAGFVLEPQSILTDKCDFMVTLSDLWFLPELSDMTTLIDSRANNRCGLTIFIIQCFKVVVKDNYNLVSFTV